MRAERSFCWLHALLTGRPWQRWAFRSNAGLFDERGLRALAARGVSFGFEALRRLAAVDLLGGRAVAVRAPVPVGRGGLRLAELLLGLGDRPAHVALAQPLGREVAADHEDEGGD